MSVEFDKKNKVVHISSPTYKGPSLVLHWQENYWQWNDLVGGTQVIHRGWEDTDDLYFIYSPYRCYS